MRHGSMHSAAYVALATATLAATAYAQSSARIGDGAVPAACPPSTRPAAPPPAQQRAARELATRAQEAAIIADNTTARSLYERAARLDPTDASVAYALGRAYESARDARAIASYCRFLVLTPAAPEAADVRRRIASLAFELGPRVPVAAAARRPALPSPGAALTLGVLFPGLGQFYTHRPVGGLLVAAAAGGALFYAAQSRTVHTTVTRTGTDPFGNRYQYQEVLSRTARPNASTGVAAAVAVSMIGAIEAYAHARGVRRSALRTAAHEPHAGPSLDVVVTPAASVGVRVTLTAGP